VEVDDGTSVMSGAMLGGIRGIIGECGGSCSCATCHVYLMDECEGEVSPLTEIEAEMLDGVAAERRQNSRLSCQIIMSNQLPHVLVQVPERQF
jgi:2Fe-2S ferredoxin